MLFTQNETSGEAKSTGQIINTTMEKENDINGRENNWINGTQAYERWMLKSRSKNINVQSKILLPA